MNSSDNIFDKCESGKYYYLSAIRTEWIYRSAGDRYSMYGICLGEISGQLLLPNAGTHAAGLYMYALEWGWNILREATSEEVEHLEECIRSKTWKKFHVSQINNQYELF